MGESPRRVHFVGIGGTGMGSLAGLVHARGLAVTGSDDVVYPPMSDLLAAWGIPVLRGFRAEHVLEDPPDLVVIGNAIRADNPEAKAVLEEGLAYLSFPDALYELAIKGRHPVVVTGTHGKTTTTALTGFLLAATGRDPSLLVGGFCLDFDGSFREGAGAHFVVEGDEYDTAFFDKTPKFLHYHPRTLILTSVEFDHADIYRDLDHVKQAFRAVVATLPADGTIVAAVNHAGVRDVLAEAPCPVVGYGADAAGEPAWRAIGLAADAEGTAFEIERPGEAPVAARLPMHGRVNVENALAALAAVASLGVPLEEAAPALARFRGVKRRQEVRGEARGVLVVDDFAHHPTAVRGSLEAMAARHPGRRIVAVFEPRTNTSRRAVFQAEYAVALAGAGRVIVARPPEGPIYSATGDVTEHFSAERLVADLRGRGVDAAAPGDTDAIVADLAADCRPGDVVLVMSNGGFDDIWSRLLDALEG